MTHSQIHTVYKVGTHTVLLLGYTLTPSLQFQDSDTKTQREVSTYWDCPTRSSGTAALVPPNSPGASHHCRI